MRDRPRTPWFDNDYTRRWSEFKSYVDRNGSEPERFEYNRLSRAVDDAAERVPWWKRI